MVQNKLHYAISGKTAPELIAERVDSDEPNMGLKTWEQSPKGKIISKDVTIAKNYLDEDELIELKSICPRFSVKIIKHLNRRFKKLTTHLREDNIDRTSNKCETFNSLPQVTRLKKICKSPKALLFRVGSIIKNYTPNFRTLQDRNKYQITTHLIYSAIIE